MTEDRPQDEPKVAYIAASLEQAHIIRNVLEERGIRAVITNEALQFGVGELPMGYASAPRVVVAREDFDRARQIIEGFDPSMSHEDQDADGVPDDEYQLELDGDSDDEYDFDDEEIEEPRHASRWPRCPSCGRPRHTSCPSCGTAGSNFAPAYSPDDTFDEDTRDAHPSVECGICDEVFAAQFPARCEWCGHRFADAREMVTPPPQAIEEQMNTRAWVLLAGLLSLGAALLGWAWYIAPRS